MPYSALSVIVSLRPKGKNDHEGHQAAPKATAKAYSTPRQRGVEDAGPAHSECWMQMLRSKDALTCCSSQASGAFFPVYCTLCEFDADMAAWRDDFSMGFERFRAGFSRRESLDREAATSLLIQAGSLSSCAVPDLTVLGARPTLEECDTAFSNALDVDVLHPQPWIQFKR